MINRQDVALAPSWCESNDFPCVIFRFSSVNESIMQSTGSALPELDLQRNDSQATPVIWTWDVYVILETLGVLLGKLSSSSLSLMTSDWREAHAPILEPRGLVLKYLSEVSLLTCSVIPSTLTCLCRSFQKNTIAAFGFVAISRAFLEVPQLE